MDIIWNHCRYCRYLLCIQYPYSFKCPSQPSFRWAVMLHQGWTSWIWKDLARTRLCCWGRMGRVCQVSSEVLRMYAEIRMPVISNSYGLLQAGVAFLNVAATEFVASWLSCIFLFSRLAVTSFVNKVSWTMYCCIFAKELFVGRGAARVRQERGTVAGSVFWYSFLIHFFVFSPGLQQFSWVP